VPVLILAILSVVLFVVTLGLLGFAEISETRKLRTLDSATTGSPFRVLSVCDAFEPDYAVLWETQVPALRRIAAAGPKGVARNQLFALHHRSATCFPELYDGSGFQQWLDFLQEAELVTIRENRISITPQGVQFLRYRVETKVAA
jgi:hypothetical protein